MKTKIIPIFVPHMGCPHTCSFCNQRLITGQQREMTPDEAEGIIRQYLTTIDSERFHVEIAFFGGSFTAIPMEKQEALLKTAYPYIENGRVDALRVSTRPDAIDEERLSLLKRYGVQVVELGVQSMEDAVLFANERGHTAKDVEDACRLVKERGFTLGVQQMPGLYGSTPEGDLETTRLLCGFRPRIARIYPTLVLKGTRLAELWESGEYRPLELEQAVVLCREIERIYEENSVKVIRVGLQMSDRDAAELIAGPYHPRFRELMRGKEGSV